MSQFLEASPGQPTSSELWVPPEADAASGLVIAKAPEDIPVVTDITPESLIYRIIGDKRWTHLGLTGLPGGIMQLMHEQIGAAVVAKEPDFFQRPWDRVFRSIPNIVGSVCDIDAETTAEWIRDKHKGVNGTGEDGVKYNAFNAEPYRVAHYVFVDSLYSMADRHTNLNLTPDDREQLYQESRVWAGRYSLSTLTVAPTYAEFREEWQDIIDNTLKNTQAAQFIIDKALARDIPALPGTAWSIAWHAKPIRSGVSEFISIAAIGGLPEDLRARLEIPFSEEDQTKLERIDEFIRQHFDGLPDVMRMHKRALRGIADREKRDKELLKAAA